MYRAKKSQAHSSKAERIRKYGKLKAILLDAHRLGLYDDNPLDGVKPPQYDPARAVIPSPGQLGALRAAGDDSDNAHMQGRYCSAPY